MNIKEIMSKEPACCTPESTIVEVAKLMVEHDCGLIPVVHDKKSKKLIGVVTDRDIACRVVARNLVPANAKVRDCMSSPVITVTADKPIADCFRVMEQNVIRRVPVIDEHGAVCGIVSQADLVEKAPKDYAQQVIQSAGQKPGWTAPLTH